MPRVTQTELMAVDLPFRLRFRHAAASRSQSESLFVKCCTSTGAVGFGESLPREYVTGETRDGAFELLQNHVLPNVAGMRFESMEEVIQFLERCEGRAPADWLPADVPQTAAWCAVELALLDAFGHSFQKPVELAGQHKDRRKDRRYSGVTSAGRGWPFVVSLLKYRLYGFKQIKLKVSADDVISSVGTARRLLGPGAHLRLDANMSWNLTQAADLLRELRAFDVRTVEQPLKSDDLVGAAQLVSGTGAEIIADESFSDRNSLQCLLDRRACTGINVRISKCGGLIAAWQLAEAALKQGLTVQIGCQVGESSVLSAAQLRLIAAVPQAKYLEGCFGTHLLEEDPVLPCLRFGYGGRRPRMPTGPGLGVEVQEEKLRQWVTRRVVIKEPAETEKGKTNVHRSQVVTVAGRTDQRPGI